MSFAKVKEAIPDYGRDIRLNIESVLSEEGAPSLTKTQIFGVALAVSYSLGSKDLVEATLADGGLDDATVEGARSAATIMAMNNVYYRSMHLLEDPELRKLPARLRMNVIGKPGIPKLDFELMSLAVSAIAGCGQCLTAHVNELRKAGMTDEGIQSTLKIAAVLQAAKTALQIKDI